MDTDAISMLIVLVFLLLALLIWQSNNFQKKLQKVTNQEDQLRAQLKQLNQKLIEKMSELASVHREIDQKVAGKNEQFRSSELVRIEEEQKKLATVWAQNQLEKWKIENEEHIRKESRTKSEDIQLGQIYKRFTPFLEEFPWLPGNTRFLGGPVDFIVFEGLHDDQLKINLHLVQVKTGQASLTKNQKRIKEALDQKRVFWKEIRAPKEVEFHEPVQAQKPSEIKYYPHGFSEIYNSMKIHVSSWKTLYKSNDFQQWHKDIPIEVRETLPLATLKKIWQEAD